MRIGLIARCRDEYFVEEFARYYLGQGVDILYIIDDDSVDKSIYDGLLAEDRVVIIFGKDIVRRDSARILYSKVREDFDWLIYVDVDEFMTTKARAELSIRDELASTFEHVHCIKVPWVMMACNGREASPDSILEGNIYRWNHDLRHENSLASHRKFRCRYANIEVKCIFRPRFFSDVSLHHPLGPVGDVRVVDGVAGRPAILDDVYENLRERDIAGGFLLCYHYRIISVENCKKKLQTSHIYQEEGHSLEDILSNDHAEVVDRSLSSPRKSTSRRAPPGRTA